MEFPATLRTHDVTPSDHLKSLVDRRVSRLEHQFGDLVHCRIVLQRALARRGSEAYHVRIELSVPNEDVVVVREPAPDTRHEPVDTAIREAFDLAERRLSKYKAHLRRRIDAEPGFSG